MWVSGVGVVCRGRKLLCRVWYPAKRGGRVVQGSREQVQMMRCYIHAGARGGVLVTCGTVQQRCRLGFIRVRRVRNVYVSYRNAANLPVHICAGD